MSEHNPKRRPVTLLLVVAGGLLLVGALVAAPLLWGASGLIVLALILGAPLFLLGSGLLSLGRHQLQLSARFSRGLPVSAAASARRGDVVRLQGQPTGEQPVTGPYSGRSAAYVRLCTTRCFRAHRKVQALPTLQRPDPLVLREPHSGATIVVPEVPDMLSHHSWGPTRWNWLDTDADRRRGERMDRLFPGLERAEGAAEHFTLQEQWLLPGESATVVGRVTKVRGTGQGREVTLGPPQAEDMVRLTDFTELEIDRLGQLAPRTRLWGHVVMAAGALLFLGGLLSLLRS